MDLGGGYFVRALVVIGIVRGQLVGVHKYTTRVPRGDRVPLALQLVHFHRKQLLSVWKFIFHKKKLLKNVDYK